MSRIRIESVLKKLEGQTVFAVTIGLYVFHLVFESNDSISVCSPFQLCENTVVKKANIEEFPIIGTRLPVLNGKEVLKTSIVDARITRLQFSDQTILNIFENIPESYSVVIGNIEYLVKSSVLEIEEIVRVTSK